MNHWDVKPDILVTARASPRPMFPWASALPRARLPKFEDHFFAHGHTYEAHPITLAPAVAAIRELQRLDLVNRAREWVSTWVRSSRR